MINFAQKNNVSIIIICGSAIIAENFPKIVAKIITVKKSRIALHRMIVLSPVNASLMEPKIPVPLQQQRHQQSRELAHISLSRFGLF